jgi:uncharacterized membrane protein YeaQ/YmgE (transglycosylase-associated protein family)
MYLDILVTWLLMGLIVGGLARFVMSAEGYGLTTDLVLGLSGGLIGSLIFQVLEISPEAGRLTLGAGAFVGASSMIVGQRFWYPRG